MAEILVSAIINAPIEKVWEIVSDIDNETKFWKGTKEIKNLSKDGNKVVREITIAFRDSKCGQEVTLKPKERIHAKFTNGIIKGSKTINLKPSENGTQIIANWEIKLSGMMGMFTGMITKHIKSGTEQALQSIKSEAER